jgi:GNAT superfamily N-acetyltransferase
VDEAECEAWFGDEVLDEGGQAWVRVAVSGVEVQHEVADQHEVGHDVGVAGPGLVLEEAGVLASVVADFATAPVVADGLQPAFRGRGIGRPAGNIVGVLPVGRLLLAVGEAAHVEGGPDMGEGEIQRFAGFQ